MLVRLFDTDRGRGCERIIFSDTCFFHHSYVRCWQSARLHRRIYLSCSKTKIADGFNHLS